MSSVQEAVTVAFSKVANHEINIVCAGCTDAGVQATNQVIHFDSDAKRSVHAWQCGANQSLPRDISVRWVKSVSDEFHARFSASSRRYQYIIHCSQNPSRGIT